MYPAENQSSTKTGNNLYMSLFISMHASISILSLSTQLQLLLCIKWIRNYLILGEVFNYYSWKVISYKDPLIFLLIDKVNSGLSLPKTPQLYTENSTEPDNRVGFKMVKLPPIWLKLIKFSFSLDLGPRSTVLSKVSQYLF